MKYLSTQWHDSSKMLTAFVRVWRVKTPQGKTGTEPDKSLRNSSIKHTRLPNYTVLWEQNWTVFNCSIHPGWWWGLYLSIKCLGWKIHPLLLNWNCLSLRPTTSPLHLSRPSPAHMDGTVNTKLTIPFSFTSWYLLADTHCSSPPPWKVKFQ